MNLAMPTPSFWTLFFYVLFIFMPSVLAIWFYILILYFSSTTCCISVRADIRWVCVTLIAFVVSGLSTSYLLCIYYLSFTHTQTHTDRHRQKKGQQTVLLKIHFQPFWTLLVDCSHVISQMVRFGSFSCGPHIGHVMINFLFILESTVYDCLNHKMTVFGPKKAKCGRNITIPKWPKW